MAEITTGDSGLFDEDSSLGGEKKFTGSEEEFCRLFAVAVKKFREPLERYLVQRGVSSVDSEEAVQDFFAKQFIKRTAICRIHRWVEEELPQSRCLGFLKTCVLRHYLDLLRRKMRHDAAVERAVQEGGPDTPQSNPINPLGYAWAVSVLREALHDFKVALIGEPMGSGREDHECNVDSPTDENTIDWRIFVERFVSPSIRKVVNGQKSSAVEIGRRLGLSRDQVMRRIQRIRDKFLYHLRQALLDSCPDADIDLLLTELRDVLILGGVRLPDLLSEVSYANLESSGAEMQIFSMVGAETSPGDELIELLVEPEPSADFHETKDLWALVMRRQYHPGEHDSASSGTAAAGFTIESVIFSPRPSVFDLEVIKKFARENGQREHPVLRQVYHLLYALAIARAKNVWNESITSLPPEQRVNTLSYAASYSWIPNTISRELELAIRKFAPPSKGGNDD